jgi:carbon monoxide dehydrogenase subunit G
MLIENELVVGLPPEKTFETLFDVQLVASCVPGAELVESISPTEPRGRVSTAWTVEAHCRPLSRLWGARLPATKGVRRLLERDCRACRTV